MSEPFDLLEYWNSRYPAPGEGTSGIASQNASRDLKVSLIGSAVEQHDIKSIYDYGCGDMNVMRVVHEKYHDVRYKGVDLAPHLIQHNQKTFPWAEFEIIEPGQPIEGSWDLLVSFDVLLHQPPGDYELMLENFRNADWKYLAIITLSSKRFLGEAWHIFPHIFTNEDAATLGTVLRSEKLPEYPSLPRSFWLIEKA